MKKISHPECLADFSVLIKDAEETVCLGKRLAKVIGESCMCIYLYGDLGTGKTTLSRGIVQGFGHAGSVKSPTYTLVEPYHLDRKNIFHFDLYRLTSAEELQFMGLDEYFSSPKRLCLIEWPNNGKGFIPPPDMSLSLFDADSQFDGSHTSYDIGRKLVCEAYTDIGQRVVADFKKHVN